MTETEANRWDGFSDEEMRELLAGEWTRGAGIAAELRQELDRRESERTSYRGPGRYVAGGRRLEVLGTIGDPGAMGAQAQVVMRDEGDHSGILMQEYLHQFNETGAYKYIGPLKDAPAPARSEAPAEVTLVRSDLDRAVLRIGNQEHHLDAGDTLTVPVMVLS